MSQITYFEHSSLMNRVGLKLIGAVFLCVGVFQVLVGWPVLLARYLSATGGTTDWLFYLTLPLLCFVAGGMVLNMFPDLGISEEGLHVQFFAVSWRCVPWQDVIGLSIVPATASTTTPVYVIRVRKLTIWHRVLGFFMGSGTSIAFSSDIMKHDRLVKELKTRIEKAQEEIQYLLNKSGMSINEVAVPRLSVRHSNRLPHGVSTRGQSASWN
ncbi:MAG: hypothetical protein KKA73_06765 [Chloroflexi bacterium]|nr:hypothetical protein [Chloroflexota bacterium]MBU1747374.1 hypothetical protein [Chloroflexota bacterium]